MNLLCLVWTCSQCLHPDLHVCHGHHVKIRDQTLKHAVSSIKHGWLPTKAVIQYLIKSEKWKRSSYAVFKSLEGLRKITEHLGAMCWAISLEGNCSVSTKFLRKNQNTYALLSWMAGVASCHGTLAPVLVGTWMYLLHCHFGSVTACSGFGLHKIQTRFLYLHTGPCHVPCSTAKHSPPLSFGPTDQYLLTVV
jgi:hypothetical protein